MSQYFETPTRPDTAAGAIAQHLRVKTPGAVAVAGASDVSIGTMDKPCLAAGPCTIRLRTAQGTRKMVTLNDIARGAACYAAAGGKIAKTGTVFEGIALEASAADNDVIEVLPAWHADLVAAAGITLPTVEFNGATTLNKLIVPDNLADALSIVEGANKYLTIVTTNSGEKVQVNKPVELTSAGAAALAVGRQGATNPALLVDASTGTSVTGLSVKSAAAAGGVAVAAISSGTNENLTVDAKGSGTITLGGTSTGALVMGRAVQLSDAGVRGGGVIRCHRERVSAGDVNTGKDLLAGIAGYKYRIHDIAMVAIGGAASGADTVDITGVQGTSTVKLLAAAVAGLTEDALLRAGSTHGAILAAGASFVACDAAGKIAIAKTGGSLATATHVDVLITYELIAE